MAHTGRISLLAALLAMLSLFAVGQTQPSAQQLVDQATKVALEKQYDKAIEILQEAIKLDPNLSTAYAGLGAAMIGMQRNGDAVEPLKTAIALDSKNAMAFTNLGIAYLNLHQYDEALRAASEAAKLTPTNARIFNLLGSITGDAGKLEESLGYFKKAYELNPREPANLHNVGLTYRRMGRYSDAIEPLKEATQKAPNYKNAWSLLGLTYDQTGHYAEALAAFTKVLELAPDDREALTNRSLTNLFMGVRGREAAQDAQRFLKVYGWRAFGSPYQAIIAIIGLREAGLEPDAQTVMADAKKKLQPGHWALNIIQFYAGEISGDDLLKIAADNDQRTEAHVYIAMDLKIKGRSDEAKPHFQWAKQYGNSTFIEYTLAIAELERQ